MTASEENSRLQNMLPSSWMATIVLPKNQMQKGDGHREGKTVLDPIVEHCRKRNIQALTVFAFSSENWNRPQYEVDLLMKLLEDTIHEQLPRMQKFNIAFRFIGDRSRLSPELQALMLQAEQRTANFDSMTLTIAISYGGMWDMAQAAKQIAADVLTNKLDLEAIDTDVFGQYVSLSDLPPVDLLIRTGGDFRLSISCSGRQHMQSCILLRPYGQNLP